MKFTLLQSYPDQLIRETFVDFSERVLSHKHDNALSIPTGFQKVLNSNSANDRSRALELFEIGLLRGLLVSSREGDRSSLPLGWSLIQSDQNVHTRLGYCSYAIGKALRSPASTRYTYIDKAFSILCAIFLLQTGFEFNNRYILTLSVFRYLQKTFYPQIPGDISVAWDRKLASAMFSTLSNSEKRRELLVAYLSTSNISNLYLSDENGNITSVNRDVLLNGSINLNSVYPLKPPLFFIGTGEEPRGLYTKAMQEGANLIECAERLERYSINNQTQNPFSAVIEKPRDIEGKCVLEILEDIFLSNGMKEEWDSAMKTLSQGTIDALQFIEGDRLDNITRVFFIHDPEIPIPASEEIVFEVIKNNCYLIPTENDRITFESNRYLVLSVDSSNELLKIRTRKIG
jgi:hypothetical protein